MVQLQEFTIFTLLVLWYSSMHFKHSPHSSESRLLIPASFKILTQMVQIMKSYVHTKLENSNYLVIIKRKICTYNKCTNFQKTQPPKL